MTEQEKKKASKGVRKNLDGEVIGEYNMRQDNTRMRNIGPTETPDLTDKQKEDLATVTDARGEGWKKTKDGVHNTKTTHKGETKPVVENVRRTNERYNLKGKNADLGTTNVYDEYENTKGDKKKVKTGEKVTESPDLFGTPDVGDLGNYHQSKMGIVDEIKTGKADQPANYGKLDQWAYGKRYYDTDPNDPELVKHKPTNNK